MGINLHIYSNNIFKNFCSIAFFKKMISFFVIVSFLMGDLAFCMEKSHFDDDTRSHTHPLLQHSRNDDKDEEDLAATMVDSKIASSVSAPVSIKSAFVESIKFYGPYMLSQIAITGNGIFNGYLYGKLVGKALEAEAEIGIAHV